MKRKDVLILLIPTALIVLLWVIFSIYHNYVSSTIPSSLSAQIISISPNFDTKTIDQIKKRTKVEPINQLSSQQISQSSSETPISSNSASEASAGGLLQ